MKEDDVEKTVPLGWVQVSDRYRRDLGDLDSLAKSIAEVGLINPITVTPDGRLIAGQRRLEAVRRLGWETIQARVVESLDSAVARLTAERDENTERKEMTISERVALGEALEKLERPKAVQRMANKPRPEATSGNPTGGRIETREVVGSAIGMSGSQYQHAKMVVKSASDPDLPPEIRKIAQAAAVEMETTGTVSRPYERVRRARAGQPVPPPTGGGRKRRPITDAAREAGWKLRKQVEQVERILDDDRWRTSKEQVATHLRGHLTYALETAQRLLDTLDKETTK